MACKHCFGKINDSEPTGVLDVFKKIKFLTNSVNLAGGEVFLNIDLLYDIIKQAVHDRLNISIITNGLVLLDHLEDVRVIYILKHIYQIGISVDSFNDNINSQIGRTTLDIDKLRVLSKICELNRTQLKIVTVVSQANKAEKMVETISALNPNTWKIIQVYCIENNVEISTDQFKSFIDNNQSDNLKIKIELSEGITGSYAMINGLGHLYLNSEFIDGFNLIDFVDNYRRQSSKEFETVLNERGFDSAKYFTRYNNIDRLIVFDSKKFTERASKRYHGGSNILFIDVEGITPRDYQVNSNRNLTKGFKPILYTGLIINENHEILTNISGYLHPQDYIIRIMSNNEKQVLSDFYHEVAKLIIDFKIGLVVSSAKNSEVSFFQELIYYGRLNRFQFEYISELMNNIFDIQSIKSSGIIDFQAKILASRNILNYLNEYRSDLFPYVRNGIKDLSSSFDVSKDLADLYLKPYKYSNLQIEKILEQIKFYCFDDVYDDWKLFNSYYSMLNLQEILFL